MESIRTYNLHTKSNDKKSDFWPWHKNYTKWTQKSSTHFSLILGILMHVNPLVFLLLDTDLDTIFKIWDLKDKKKSNRVSGK